MVRLQSEQLDQITEAVRLAEEKTRGEIVPVILPRADEYRWVDFFLAGFFALIAPVLAWFTNESFSAGGWASISGLEIFFAAQACGALLGLTLAQIPVVRRSIVPRGQRSRAVEAQAFHHFTRQGVMNTEDRSGVLVLICLFEHEVAILADQGIHQRVSVEYWKEETERLSRELKQGGDLTCVLIEGISRLGALLAKNFPRDPDSRNELANRPVIGE